MKANTRALTKEARQAVWDRDGGECRDCHAALCGIGKNVSPSPKPYYCIHHIRPRQAGGSNELENLLLLCTECHGARESEERSASRAARYWYQDLPLLLRVLIEMRYGNFKSYLPNSDKVNAQKRAQQEAT